jgi:SAM-dependent methyltransferase
VLFNLNDSENIFRRVIRRIDRLMLGLDVKSYSERAYWKDDIPRFVSWYNGELAQLYGHPAPAEGEKVRKESVVASAICTMVKLNIEKDRRYLSALDLSADAFSGKIIADIGCGPMANVLVFEGAQIIGVDPLVDVYRKIGYPLDSYDRRISYLANRSEHIDLPDASVDAVISVNAIDHVDDFEATADEIKRILKPDGRVRFEIHYHKPRVCEPHELDDDRVLQAFRDIGIKKIKSREFGKDITYTKELEGELLVIWGN